jgi:nucleotide-binding universal stress UspA family protein
MAPRDRHAAEAYLTGLCQQWQIGCGDPAWHIRWGDPAEQILQEIVQHPCNLIAMATHGRIGVSRLFLGSVTETILHRGKTPVLVVNPHLLDRERAKCTAPGS